MKLVRLYAASDGETHFEDVEVEMTPVEFAPGLPRINASAPTGAADLSFIHIPAGWASDFHPVPRREFALVFSGEVEIEVSDGEVRRFGQGSIWLIEDTTGKGHKFRVVGADDCFGAVVILPG
jgi:hypothetical protein